MGKPSTTAALFERFAEAKGIKSDCEVCGSSEGWNIYTHAGVHTVLTSGSNGEIFRGPYGINAIAMKCRNCANIRLFELEAVEHWAGLLDIIEVRPPEGGDHGGA